MFPVTEGPLTECLLYNFLEWHIVLGTSKKEYSYHCQLSTLINIRVVPGLRAQVKYKLVGVWEDLTDGLIAHA